MIGGEEKKDVRKEARKERAEVKNGKMKGEEKGMNLDRSGVNKRDLVSKKEGPLDGRSADNTYLCNCFRTLLKSRMKCYTT